VSEARGIKVADVILEGSPMVRLHGKGRKDRTVPLWPATAAQIRRWLLRIDPAPGGPLFPAASGGPLTRSAITDRLKRATKAAVGRIMQSVFRPAARRSEPQGTPGWPSPRRWAKNGLD
jgi:integrase/recombinase XerD